MSKLEAKNRVVGFAAAAALGLYVDVGTRGSGGVTHLIDLTKPALTLAANRLRILE